MKKVQQQTSKISSSFHIAKCHVQAGLQECMIERVYKCKGFIYRPKKDLLDLCSYLLHCKPLHGVICGRQIATLQKRMTKVTMATCTLVEKALWLQTSQWPLRTATDVLPSPPALVTNDATEPNQTQHLFRIVHRQMEDRVLSDYFILTVFSSLEGWSPKSSF